METQEIKIDRLNQIERLKDELHATDFIVLKAIEGHDVRQYGDYKTMRQQLRDEINLIESMTEEQYNTEYPIDNPLEKAKRIKLMAIEVYDKSDNVNIFYLNNQSLWLDAPTRQQLRISIEAYQAQGENTVSKWFEGQEYTFNISSWFAMLNALERYASDALNVTERHKAAINAMDSIKDVEDYDITQGYPEKLIFPLENLS